MAAIESIALAERRLAPVERINRAGVALTASLEFFPPRTPDAAARLEQATARLVALRPQFVSVTYGAGGTTRDETFATVVALKSAGLEVAAHLTCVAHEAVELRQIARRYLEVGIRHIVALRGDLPADTRRPLGSPPHATDLVRLLNEEGVPEITVAAFPEGHPESDFDVAREIENLLRKQEAGATAAITQLSFDNAHILGFIDRARAAGVTIPIVPGILPVTNVAQTRHFAQTIGAEVPEWLDGVLEGLDDDPVTRDLVAASIAAEQCADLATHGVDHIHLYTLNRAELALAIGRLVGIRARAIGANDSRASRAAEFANVEDAAP